MLAQMFQLDCWGNAEDGYEVNDLFKLEEKEVGDDFDRKGAIEFIEGRFGKVHESMHLNNYFGDDFEWDLCERSTGRPVIAVRLVEG